MATFTVSTTSAWQSAVNGAASGDTIILNPGVYTGWYVRPGITIQSSTWQQHMAVTDGQGHYGAGMQTVVRGVATQMSAAGVTVRGVWVDYRPYGGLNQAYTDAQDVTWEDCVFTMRRSDGGRSIGHTLMGGAGMNWRMARCRVSGSGKAGELHDHPIYAKKTWYSGGMTSRTGTPGWTVEDCIFQTCSGWALHGYTQGSGGIFRRNIAHDCASMITFSAADQAGDSSTGWWGATSCVDVLNCIASDKNSAAAPGAGGPTALYHVECWDGHSTLDPYDNWVKDTAIYQGSGTVGRIKPGQGTRFQLSNVFGADGQSPGYADPANGNFRLSTSSRAYTDGLANGAVAVGPQSIQPGFAGGGGGSGPPPPPPAGTFGAGTPAVFTDAFAYADGALSTGNAAWQAGPWVSDGTLNVASGKLQTSEADGSNSNNLHTTIHSLASNPPGLDFVWLGVENPSTTGKHVWGYALHSAPGSGSTHNGYYVRVTGYSGTDLFALFKVTAGVESAALISESVEWVSGASMGLRITDQGKLSLWKTVTGVWTQVGSEVTDTSFTSGRVGVATNSNVGKIDSMSVLPIGASVRRGRFAAALGL